MQPMMGEERKLVYGLPIIALGGGQRRSALIYDCFRAEPFSRKLSGILDLQGYIS